MAKHAFLGLVPLGPVDPDILRTLRTALAKFLPLPVQVLPPQPLPPETYHVVRQQYHAHQLLELLLDAGDSGAFRILGVTAGDLYIPILTFVFGEAQLNGKAALISLFRPRGDTDAITPPRPVMLERLIKLGLHELGHTFGLEHCRQDGCLMEFSSNLKKLDQRSMAFCKYCQVLLTDSFRDQGLVSPLRPYEEMRAPDSSTPVAGNSRKHRP